MIEIRHGDLLQADVDAYVSAVNTMGVIGKGIALQFKQAYPDMFKAYQKACKSGELQTGRMHLFDRGGSQRPRYIINFPTKQHWRHPSKIEYIQEGLPLLVAEVKRNDIRSIALPALGCGLGGLEWNEVFPMIQAAFAELPEVRVVVYPPVGVEIPLPPRSGWAESFREMAKNGDDQFLDDDSVALTEWEKTEWDWD